MNLLKSVKINYLELNDFKEFGVFLPDLYNLRFCANRLALGLCVFCFVFLFVYLVCFVMLQFSCKKLYGLWLSDGAFAWILSQH